MKKILLFAILTSFIKVNSQNIIAEHTGSSTGSTNFGKWGQSFTANSSGMIDKIQFVLSQGSILGGTWELYSGSGLDGTLLAQGNVNPVSTTGIFQDFVTIPTFVSLTSGSIYTIYFTSFSLSGSYSVQLTNGSSYSGGDWYNDGDILFGLKPSPVGGYDAVFRVLSKGASLTTSEVISITKVSAVVGGDITSDNGNSVTERGVVYSTSDTTPSIGEAGVNKKTNGIGIGVFSQAIDGLTEKTTYYYRAYAVNSSATSYGEVKSFITLYDPKVVSITRYAPINAIIDVAEVTFRVLFNVDMNSVDVTDFSLNTTIGGTINSVSQIDKKTYDVSIININNSNGTIGLGINGVDGVTGTNNIVENVLVLSEAVTIAQVAANDYLNQSKLGQTFTATTNNKLTAFTIFPKDGQHTFDGTATLKVYNGDETSGGTEIYSETVSISDDTSASGQKISLTTCQDVTLGSTYSIVLTDFSGSGYALESNKTETYTGGHAIFTGQTSSHDTFDFKIKIFEGLYNDSNGGVLADIAPITSESYSKNGVLDVKQINLDESVKVYPIPVANELNIKSNESRIHKISIYNMQSQKIKEMLYLKEKIDFSNVSSGVYIIKIETDKGTIIKRVYKK